MSKFQVGDRLRRISVPIAGVRDIGDEVTVTGLLTVGQCPCVAYVERNGAATHCPEDHFERVEKTLYETLFGKSWFEGTPPTRIYDFSCAPRLYVDPVKFDFGETFTVNIAAPKPIALEDLKVGDEVTVRAIVENIDYKKTVRLRMGSSFSCFFPTQEDIATHTPAPLKVGDTVEDYGVIILIHGEEAVVKDEDGFLDIHGVQYLKRAA